MKPSQRHMQTVYFAAYHFNGNDHYAEHQLVPDRYVPHLGKLVTAEPKWGRGRGLVTGIVRGAMKNKHDVLIYLVECEVTRKLVKCRRPIDVREAKPWGTEEEARREAECLQAILAEQAERRSGRKRVASDRRQL